MMKKIEDPTFEAMIIYQFNGKKQFLALKNINLQNGAHIFDNAYKIKTGYAQEDSNKPFHFNFTKEIAHYYIGEVVDKSTAQKHVIFKKVKREDNYSQLKYVLTGNGTVYELEDWEEVLTKEKLSNLKLYQLFDENYYLGLN